MILIVDDKSENLFSLQKTLAADGLEADIAGSGEEALKKILKHDYELIILDVQMPGMDGFEVAEAISGYSRTRDIPILFLSAASTEKRFITKGYGAGGIDYVTKPADPDILLLKVKNFIRLYRQTRELQQAEQKLKEEIEIRRKAEETSRQQAAQLHSILESLPQLAFTAGPDGALEYTNGAWLQFASAPLRFPAVPPGDEPLDAIWQRAVASGHPVEREVRLLNGLNGDCSYYLLRALPVRQDGEVPKWVGTFTDIQQQKSASELLEQKVADRTSQLTATNRELEESNHELQQFTSVASHDLKEPLRKIQIFSAMVRDKMIREGEANDALRGYLDRIVNASGRMTGLINDLLQFSKLSAGERFVETDLNELLPEILSDLEIQIQEKGARIELGMLPSLQAVPGQMRQVFQNLISNAIKFSAPGIPPHIRISSESVPPPPGATTDSKGPWCCITVQDNGIGFEEVYLEKIFTLFQRLHDRESYEGTGIGLAIAKKIMQRHNGSITARSRPGEGAAFLLTLPLTQPQRSTGSDED